MIEEAWNEFFLKYNTLGLWHATHYLKTVNTVRDPSEQARDVVQNAWLSLWRRGVRPEDKFKGLFITTVIALSMNAARDSRPIEITYAAKPGSRRSKITSTFPVQIFATTLDDIQLNPCEFSC